MTRVLLDTHVLLWALAEPEKLSGPAVDLLEDGDVDLLVSVATIWEIAVKRGSGKLEAVDDLPVHVEAFGVTLMPVNAQVAWSVQRLPPYHGDPFDRLVIAQAKQDALPVVTRDRAFTLYDIDVVW